VWEALGSSIPSTEKKNGFFYAIAKEATWSLALLKVSLSLSLSLSLFISEMLNDQRMISRGETHLSMTQKEIPKTQSVIGDFGVLYLFCLWLLFMYTQE
jgi:hypothetical protein